MTMYTPLLSQDGEDEAQEDSHPWQEEEDEEEVLWSLEHMESTKLLGEGKKTYDDPETRQEKVKYPRSVFFIIGNEFCERFSYYGMKAILTLYLHYQLHYSEDDSTVIYHIWSMLCYFTPVLGAIIADTLLGRFRTIFYISIIYVLGNSVLSLASIPPMFPDLGPKIVISLVGLFLIALGTGGIKPCVSAFGGDQFVLPQQERQLTQFFSIFYFSINAGSLISTFLTPVLRDDVQCFGDDCYALAFGVPAVLMFVALFIFVAGYFTHLYKIIPAQGSALTNVFRCIWHALQQKFRSNQVKEHWLDYADDKFEKQLILDVKVLLKILLLYIPLPFFWALFDQQGSRWTFQATRMDGELGGWTLKPDQMQVVNPFFILLLIPVFDSFIYPLLARCNLLKRQLPRIFTGGVLAGVAFLVSGFLELKLETTYPVPVKSGETRISFINGLPCNVNLGVPWKDQDITLSHLEEKVFKSIKMNETEEDLHVTLDFKTPCGNVNRIDRSTITVTEKTAHVVMITADSNIAKMVNVNPPDDIEKSGTGLPKLRMLFNIDMVPFNSSVLLQGKTEKYKFYIEETEQGYISGTDFQEVEPDSYDVFMPVSLDTYADEASGNFDVKLGGVYNFIVQKSLNHDAGNETSVKLYEVTPANSVHMLWLIPQYFIITVSEVMFSITGLEFSFTQAPSSMKSVLQAAWLLTVSFGNLIVVIIAEAKFFERQALEFFLFAVLMFVDMIVFAVLAVSYKYVDEIAEDNRAKGVDSEKQGKINEGYSDETKF